MPRSRRATALGVLAGLALVGAGGFWLFTAPVTLPAEALAEGYRPDVAHGALLFTAGGCASCHAAPTAKGEDRLKLGGGLALTSAYGTFYPPNISSDREHGIGAWSEADFANALLRGVGLSGEHLYPSFPYTSYQRMSVEDARDLFAYLKTLPAVATPSRPHDIRFPFNVRRLLGGWKRLYVDGQPFRPDPAHNAAWNRGAYLVEGPAHCAECHSPRNALGAIVADRRFSGGPSPDGQGWVPNITHGPDGIGSWSQDDVAELLKTGTTPDFDTVGGSMAEVVENTAGLSDADRAAIAAYIVSLPSQPGRPPEKAGG